MGKANCAQCHNGPLFTNNEFPNTGVPPRAELPIDDGRLVTDDHSLQRAYKVPSLRIVAERAPYMNAGQFATLAQVLDHYNRAPKAAKGHTELKPLSLKTGELRQLEAFLKALTGPIVVNGAALRIPGQ